jgi:hypothetical protein
MIPKFCYKPQLKNSLVQWRQYGVAIARDRVTGAAMAGNIDANPT